MTRYFFTALLTVLSFTTYSQNLPDEIIKKFFNEYPKNSDKAIDDIYATNIWTTRIKDGIENIKKEINSYTIDYVGKYYGYELIARKQFSESFILYSYMVKYDRQPMRFIFKLYKPSDKWTLYSFSIDSDLDSEIQEAAKIYYLDLNKDN